MGVGIGAQALASIWTWHFPSPAVEPWASSLTPVPWFPGQEHGGKGSANFTGQLLGLN